MTLIYWPAELPQYVVRDGYTETLPDGRIQSRMDGGPNKVRRRFSSAVRPISAAMFLTIDQKARFDRFWDIETSGGSLPFRIRDQAKDKMPILTNNLEKVLTTGGVPLLVTAYWIVMFAEPPQISAVGAQFSASFTLNVMP